MIKKIAFLISTLFYSGYFPKAPGTFGSFVSLPIIFVICYNFGLYGLVLAVMLSFVIALFAVKKVLTYTEHDPSFIVIDEFIGQSVTFLFVADKLKGDYNSILYFIGFILFRIFDVAKPFPVSYADKKIKNALGVILDDVFAGIYAAVILLFLFTFTEAFK